MEPDQVVRKEECKNHKALKRVLNSHLDIFERLTNWAEMADWLQKLARHIETYNTLYLPCKKAIAKRLNQCLNIPGLPIGIHRTNMSIYDLVFEILNKRRSALAKNIAIFSFGLFSMFKRAQLEIKHSIIALFEKFYLPLEEQLIPMLNGLIGCLLSGMNDSETEMKAKILKLLAKVNRCVGDFVYMTALWQVLLKNSQTQLQCIKAIIYKFEKSKDKLKNNKKDETIGTSGNISINSTSLNRNDSNFNENQNKISIQSIPKSSMPNLKIANQEEVAVEELELKRNKFAKMIKVLKLGNEMDIRRNFFPDNLMIVNAINKCLRNPNVHVVKGILDLLIGYVAFKMGKFC